MLHQMFAREFGITPAIPTPTQPKPISTKEEQFDFLMSVQEYEELVIAKLRRNRPRHFNESMTGWQ